MKINKAPESEEILMEMLSETQQNVLLDLKHLFNISLQQQIIPTNRNEEIIVIV